MDSKITQQLREVVTSGEGGKGMGNGVERALAIHINTYF